MRPIEVAVSFYKRFRNETSASKDYEFVITDFQHTPYPSTIDKHYEIVAVDFSCPAAKDFVFDENGLMHSTWIMFDATGSKVPTFTFHTHFRRIELDPSSARHLPIHF